MPKSHDSQRGIYVAGSDARFSAGPKLRNVLLLRTNATSDLMVVEYALRLLNLWVLLVRRPKCEVALWGHFKQPKSRYRASLQRVILRRANSLGYRFITYSEAHKSFLVANGLDSNRISIALNGWISDSSILRARSTLVRGGRRPKVVGIPGSLYASRVDNRWFEKVQTLANHYEVRIFGSGPLEERAIKSFRDNDRVRFYGALSQDELHSELSSCDLLFLMKPVGGLVVECVATGRQVLVEEHEDNGPEVEITQMFQMPNLIVLDSSLSPIRLLASLGIAGKIPCNSASLRDSFERFDEMQKIVRRSVLDAFMDTTAGHARHENGGWERRRGDRCSLLSRRFKGAT